MGQALLETKSIDNLPTCIPLIVNLGFKGVASFNCKTNFGKGPLYDVMYQISKIWPCISEQNIYGILETFFGPRDLLIEITRRVSTIVLEDYPNSFPWSFQFRPSGLKVFLYHLMQTCDT